MIFGHSIQLARTGVGLTETLRHQICFQSMVHQGNLVRHLFRPALRNKKLAFCTELRNCTHLEGITTILDSIMKFGSSILDRECGHF